MAETVAQPCAQHQQAAKERRIPGRDEGRVGGRACRLASIAGSEVTTTVTPGTSTNCTRHSESTATPVPDARGTPRRVIQVTYRLL